MPREDSPDVAMLHRSDTIAVAGGPGEINFGAAKRQPGLQANDPRVRWPAPEMVDACRKCLLQIGPDKRTFAVTSCGRGDGRTSIAIALAHAHAYDNGGRTLLLDLDLANSELAPKLSIGARRGMADVIEGRSALDDVIHRVNGQLFVVTAGTTDANSQMFASPAKALEVVAALQDRFDTIVADLPPLLESADGPLLARGFEVSILVVRAARTSLRDIRTVADSLATKPLVILNDTGSRTTPRWLRPRNSR